MNQQIVKVENLSVSYQGHYAVKQLSFELLRGQSLGLIGVNGAGKTSTLRALLGMMRISEGSVTVFGSNKIQPQLFKSLGFAPEDGLPLDYMNGAEYLDYMGQFKCTDRNLLRQQVSDLLKAFDLEPKKAVKTYSNGMKRRLILAQAFLGKPELLILDEPLNGLDPIMIAKLRETLDSYRTTGGTVLYSSHILVELEKSCTHVLMLHEGKSVVYAPMEPLVKEFGSVEKAFISKVGAH